MFAYKTYVASCFYNSGKDLLEGRILGIMDDITFSGANLKMFLYNFYREVDRYEENRQ